MTPTALRARVARLEAEAGTQGLSDEDLARHRQVKVLLVYLMQSIIEKLPENLRL
jgi:hypothetical protein